MSTDFEEEWDEEWADEEWCEDPEGEDDDEEIAECPECGTNVVAVSDKCPECGRWFLEGELADYTLRSRARSITSKVLVMLLVLLLIFLFALS